MAKKKKSRFVKKFKKQKKILRVMYIAVGLIYLICLIFFTKSILTLKAIETLIRVIILIVLYLIFILYWFLGILLLFTGKKKRFILLVLFVFILSPVMAVASYYIDKTFGIIDKAQKKYVTYTSVMIALNDTNNYKTIGIINSKNDPVGYVIPKEILEEEKIDANIVKYDDYISMLTDLYEGALDSIFVADSYVTMFNSYERFANIANDVKIVFKKSKEMENVDNIVYSTKDLTEPFTLLLMGVDGTGNGINNASSFNGDSLMLITFNPKTLTSTIFSIPRDTYVPISCNANRESKINSSAYGGTSCVVNTIQNLIDIKIDYYVKINFTGVVNLVNDLGGVTVDVPIDFCEQDSERRFGEYQICLKKGVQKLDGEAALALARHRHSLPLGDFQRVQHQQLVVEAMIKELKNINTPEEFYKILDDVINNIDTNISTTQMLSLYNVAKNILVNKLSGSQSILIQKTYLTGYDLSIYLNSTKSYTYTFQYYKNSLKDIVEAMKINLELEKPSLTKTFNYNANEVYTKKTIGYEYYNEQRKETMPNFVGKTRDYVESWGNERGIKVNIKEVKEGNSLYNTVDPNDTVVGQDEHPGILVSDGTVVNISVLKKTEIVENKKDNSSDDEVGKLPDFKGMKVSNFNSWKNTVSKYNIIFNVEELDEVDIESIGKENLEADTIYKQSISKGTLLSEITTLTVYYYKE